jgi:hypothetical protein
MSTRFFLGSDIEGRVLEAAIMLLKLSGKKTILPRFTQFCLRGADCAVASSRAGGGVSARHIALCRRKSSQVHKITFPPAATGTGDRSTIMNAISTFRRHVTRRRSLPISAAAIAGLFAASAFGLSGQDGSIRILGSPSNLGAHQYSDFSLPSGFSGVTACVGNGVAVFNASGLAPIPGLPGTFVGLGERAVRWTPSGAVELQTLGLFDGYTNEWAYCMSPTGAIVGSSEKYFNLNGVASVPLGSRAVRWDANGAVTELGSLGTDSSGITDGTALAINSAGTVGGQIHAFDASGKFLGAVAVRWDAGTLSATALGNLGTDSSGVSYSAVEAINDAGTSVGFAEKYNNAAGTRTGLHAARWNAGSTAAVDLGGLGTDGSGLNDSNAVAIDASGTAVGFCEIYDAAGTDLGARAVRWNSSTTAATELGNLSAGYNTGSMGGDEAVAINNAGTAVGFSEKFDSCGKDLGERAARWEASGTAVTELGILGNDSDGLTRSTARNINSAGLIVGLCSKYDSAGNFLSSIATLWGPDGVAIDLNTLVTPNSGWTLTEADSISDTNWITGLGQFDPDGSGPQSAYTRPFLIQLPEPTMAFPLAILLCAVARLRGARSGMLRTNLADFRVATGGAP